MKPFKPFSGVAAPLLRENIDTDTIIPSREMQKVSRSGLGDGLFAGWRYKDPISREINPEFVLNKAQYENARIILAGKNFGCGSSREHAVWALKEFGIKAIIAPSFGSIFLGNCIRNCVLPLSLPQKHLKKLICVTQSNPQKYLINVDLLSQSIEVIGIIKLNFAFDQADKEILIEGLDAISLTEKSSREITEFEERDRKIRPWIYL